MQSLNQKFDPNLHGAMFETVSTTVEPGTVVSEFKSGFLYAPPLKYQPVDSIDLIWQQVQRARAAARPGWRVKGA
jgi:hypothetical protein